MPRHLQIQVCSLSLSGLQRCLSTSTTLALFEGEVRADGAIPEDLKILPNDWPYGVDQDIVHIIVWTKFRFDEDPNTGDLTPTARQQIDDFINRTFRCRVGKENVRFWSMHSLHSVYFGIDTDGNARIGAMVQELGEHQECESGRAFPCHALQAQEGVCGGDHGRRRASTKYFCVEGLKLRLAGVWTSQLPEASENRRMLVLIGKGGEG